MLLPEGLSLLIIAPVFQLCVEGVPVSSEVTGQSDAHRINTLSLRIGSPPE